MSKIFKFHRRCGEDVIDWMHRLAKEYGLKPDRISEITGLPLVSVNYWWGFNGYDDSAIR